MTYVDPRPIAPQTGENTVKATPTADKLLSIIANRFNVRKTAIWPTTTWEQLNRADEKDAILDEISEKFFVRIPAAARPAILTVWDALRWVEGNPTWLEGGVHPNG